MSIPARGLPRTASLVGKAVFSAVLLSLSLPNEFFRYGLWPLGFIALVPLYSALRLAPSWRTAALVGAVFGGLQHALSSYWLFFYKDFALWTIGGTTLGYALVYVLPTWYVSFVLRNSVKYRPALFALLWAGFEFIKSTGFLGYPWGLIPYSLTSLPVMLQIADITGVYGLSALLAFSSAIIAEAASLIAARQSVRSILPWAGFGAICAAMILAYGIYRLETPIPVVATIKAIIVQQNVDPWIAGEESALKSNVELTRKILGGNTSRSATAGTGSAAAPPVSSSDTLPFIPARPDLIIFSETSLRRTYTENTQYFSIHPAEDPLIPLIKESGAHLLTGAPYVLDWDNFQVMNSAILIAPDGKLTGFYGKSHPVPFTEAIPFMEFAWFRSFMKNVIGLESGWTTGTRLTVFDLPLPAGTVRFSTPICFEDAFAGLCGDFIKEGADLLVNITNDSWSQTVSAEVQHWASARIRAIETRRTLVRSTNGGVSCVIGAKGETLLELPLFTADAALFDVPVYKENNLTLYTRFGDWFAVLCLLLSAVAIIILIARTRRTQ